MPPPTGVVVGATDGGGGSSSGNSRLRLNGVMFGAVWTCWSFSEMGEEEGSGCRKEKTEEARVAVVVGGGGGSW
ncbi:hypothetical protein L596_014137 [Steinernema carpocapsae]|uniref:Uncharacterized protein n=1 Tax=Steinernema carpocapsae TaxID=34508 RepID=A0A4U5NAR7_STECR|nr:hypothetical protein L596_014137 [Steinernema carpocapsae]